MTLPKPTYECDCCKGEFHESQMLVDDHTEKAYCPDCWDALSEEAMYNGNPEKYFGTDR